MKVRPGDPINISARVWNRLVDIANGSLDYASDAKGMYERFKWVWVKNTTGIDLFRGSPIFVDPPAFLDPSTVFRMDSVFSGSLAVFGPASDRFGILIEGIPANGVGRVAISGVVFANLTTVGSLGAQPTFVHCLPSTHGDAGIKLQRNVSGFARIVAEQYVRLGDSQRLFSFVWPSAPSGQATIRGLRPHGVDIGPATVVSSSTIVQQSGICVATGSGFLSIPALVDVRWQASSLELQKTFDGTNWQPIVVGDTQCPES